MSGQRFTTLDQLCLEVERERDPGQLSNLIQNPNGDLGSWGWITPVPNSVLTSTDDGLQLRTTATQHVHVLSELLPVTAGHTAGARLTITAISAAPVTVRARLVFVDAVGAVVSTGPQSGPFTNTAGEDVLQLAGMVAPAGATYVQLRLDLYGDAAGTAAPFANTTLSFRNVVVAASADAGLLGSSRTNLFRNPSIEYDPFPHFDAGVNSLSRSNEQAAVGTYSLKVQKAGGAGQLNVSTLGMLTVEPGRPLMVSWRSRGGTITGSRQLTGSIVWYAPNGAPLGVSSSIGARGMAAGGQTWNTNAELVTVPAGAGFAILNWSLGSVPSLESFYLDAIMVEVGDQFGVFFDGDTPDAGGVTYSWTGTPGNSTSTAVVPGQLPYIPPVEYLSILGTAHEIVVDRQPLDVGELSGQLIDASLDPADSDVIRPGRRCRLGLIDANEPLFSGTLRRAEVTYDLRAAKASKRARITLTATDATTELANVPRPDGVATIAELPHVLEGAGVPWNVNGSGDQVPNAVVVAVNDNASALDQIAITRDSSLGHAWIDRYGVLQAWDEAQLSWQASAALLTEASYTDLQIDYDTDRCINTVTVKFLRTNPDTGETEEVTHGPYVDQPSVAEWGARAATFTIQWQDEDPAAIESFALAILAANATPAKRVNSLTLPIRQPADLQDLYGYKTATLDLLDLVTVQHAGVVWPLRVQGLTHRISAKRWTLEVAFSRDGQVASPQFTPSPSGGAGGKTLAELLRPVGEVTMFFGTPAQIPAGWFELNGGNYDPVAYPKLADHLAIAAPSLPAGVLPDWNDRFPVGASVAKPLGTAGGSSTSTAITGSPRSGTVVNRAGGGTADVAGSGHDHSVTVDTAPPWRAIRFLIRAR